MTGTVLAFGLAVGALGGGFTGLVFTTSRTGRLASSLLFCVGMVLLVFAVLPNYT